MNSRFRSLTLNVLLVFASLLTAAFIAEVGLRIVSFSYVSFHRHDDRLGIRLREGIVGSFASEGRAEVRINSAGFRDQERTQAKLAGAFRIAVLGDSYVEGLQVDLAKTFPALLEEHLNSCAAFGSRPVEVLNFGVSSYGTAQQLLTFRLIAAKYAPDLVISAFFSGNDVRNNSRELETDKLRPFFSLRDSTLIEDRSFATSADYERRTSRVRILLGQLRASRLAQAVYYVKDRLQTPVAQSSTGRSGAAMFEAGIDNAVFVEPTTQVWRDAWAITERILSVLNDEVRATGARLLVVTLTSGAQVHPDQTVRRQFQVSNGIQDIFYPDRRLESVATKLNIDSIVLAPEMQQLAERDKTFFHGFANTRMGTGHWNEAGHRAAADIIAARLCTRATAP